MRSPLFIFGHPRSGTTLVRAVLGLHSKIELRNEPELLFAMVHAGCPEILATRLSERQDLVRRLRDVGLCRRHLEGLPPGTVERLLQQPRLTFRQLYEGLLPLPAGDGERIWGEKSINNVFFVERLKALYPDALLLYVVRDPRAVALSKWRKRHRRRPRRDSRTELDAATDRELESAWVALKWSRWALAAARGRDSVGSGDWMDVRFESFVRQPVPILEEICGRLGVRFEPRMLSARARRQDPVLASEHAGAHRNLGRELDPSRALAGADLADAETWLVERFAAEAMVAEGYEPRNPALDGDARRGLEGFLDAWQGRLEGRLRRYLARRCVAELSARR